MAEPTPRTVKTLDQILADLSDLSDVGEGAQRTQALRMLLSHRSQSDVMLPPLMDYEDARSRLARLMRSIGPQDTKKAWHLAFPNLKKQRPYDPIAVNEHGIEWSNVKFPRTVRQFHRMFPELKNPKGGHPPGYPARRSVEMKLSWLRERTKEILIDRKRQEMEIHSREQAKQFADTAIETELRVKDDPRATKPDHVSQD